LYYQTVEKWRTLLSLENCISLNKIL
jgi:hypothetical protein